MEYLVYCKDCAKNFTYINDFNPHDNSKRQIWFYPHFVEGKREGQREKISCLSHTAETC